MKLQWSRANNGAETRRNRVTRERKKEMLQWSRANNGAETNGRVRFFPSNNRSFNGAAPTMARKPPLSGGILTSGGQLQWSRANNGAETDQYPQAARSALQASMEPRQQWRGNQKYLSPACDSQKASMEPRQQWRGNLRSAINPPPRLLASMEPRQQWRGNKRRVR